MLGSSFTTEVVFRYSYANTRANPGVVSGIGYPVKATFKGLKAWPKVSHLFSDSEVYHEQMDPIPSSNGSLDKALSNMHTLSPRQRTFQTIDATEFASKLTQSWWCLHWFLGLRADVWKTLLQMHTKLVITEVWTEKNVQQKYKNKVSEHSFSPLSASLSATIVQW